jgi:hypothetical protein
MKTGAIIYIAGDTPIEGLKHNPEKLVSKFGINADRWGVITRNTGHFDIHDAWWSLITGGMQRILCMMAEIDQDGELKLTGRKLRLCG